MSARHDCTPHTRTIPNRQKLTHTHTHSQVRILGSLLVYLLPLKDDAFQLCLRRRRLTQEAFGGVFFAALAPSPLVLFTPANKDWGFPAFWLLMLISYKLAKVLSTAVRAPETANAASAKATPPL